MAADDRYTYEDNWRIPRVPPRNGLPRPSLSKEVAPAAAYMVKTQRIQGPRRLLSSSFQDCLRPKCKAPSLAVRIRWSGSESLECGKCAGGRITKPPNAFDRLSPSVLGTRATRTRTLCGISIDAFWKSHTHNLVAFITITGPGRRVSILILR